MQHGFLNLHTNKLQNNFKFFGEKVSIWHCHIGFYFVMHSVLLSSSCFHVCRLNRSVSLTPELWIQATESGPAVVKDAMQSLQSVMQISFSTVPHDRPTDLKMLLSYINPTCTNICKVLWEPETTTSSWLQGLWLWPALSFWEYASSQTATRLKQHMLTAGLSGETSFIRHSVLEKKYV